MDICSRGPLWKKICCDVDKTMPLYKMSCYPEPNSPNKSKIKVELNSTNNAANSDIEKAEDVASKFAK